MLSSALAADVALSFLVACTPQLNEGLSAQPCPSDANSATAADVIKATLADDAASSTTCTMQLADSSYADDTATQESTNHEETASENH